MNWYTKSLIRSKVALFIDDATIYAIAGKSNTSSNRCMTLGSSLYWEKTCRVKSRRNRPDQRGGNCGGKRLCPKKPRDFAHERRPDNHELLKFEEYPVSVLETNRIDGWNGAKIQMVPK